MKVRKAEATLVDDKAPMDIYYRIFGIEVGLSPDGEPLLSTPRSRVL